MTQLSFTVPGKGFSVNQAYYKNRATKTVEARAWEHNMAMHLDEIKALTDFADTWKAAPTNTGIELGLTFNYPAHVFYTKDKRLSNKSFDVDNCAKLMIDILFGGRLGINDKEITKLVLEKAAGANYGIDVLLRIR